MSNRAISRNGIPVRLTDERWTHIVTEHGELTDLQNEVLQTLENPQRILAGKAGELMAVRETDVGKWLVVVYRERADDGFVITAFLTRRERSLNKRVQIWP